MPIQKKPLVRSAPSSKKSRRAPEGLKEKAPKGEKQTNLRRK
jgi:hypothetical protein